MSLPTVQPLDFHLEQCPRCIHYQRETQLCMADLEVLGPRPLANATHDPCPMFLQQRPAEPASAIASPPVPVPDAVTPSAEEPAPPVSAAAPVQQVPLQGEPHLYCPKCKFENPSTATRCQRCDSNLLPGENAVTRLVGFITSLVIAGVLAFLFYRIYVISQTSVPDLACLNPITLGGGSLIAFVTGFVLLFRKTPLYLRYSNRAERHLQLNPFQALDDINRAIAIAPEKQRGGLVKQRIKIYEKLGRAEDAARDRLKLALAPDAFKNEAEWVSMITGGDADAYTVGRRSGQVKSILNAGTAKAVGYCPKCDMAVELDTDQRCLVHPKEKGREVEVVIPADIRAGQLAVMQKNADRSPGIRAALNSMLASGEAKAIGFCPKCQFSVDLDAQFHCPLHPKSRIKTIHYILSGREGEAKLELTKSQKFQQRGTEKNLVAIVLALVSLVVVLFILVPGFGQFLTNLFH